VEPVYKKVNSSSVSISYHERGVGDPLVLIMGFGADGQVWDKHAGVYEKHFRCIIPDNRGVGRSDQPPGPYSTRQMADDVIAVMDDAGVRQARIAGISMGGAIAQEVVINYPERVRSLLLVSTWARFDNYATAIYENLKHLRVSSEPEHFTELLQLWIYAPPYYEHHYTELKKAAAAKPERPQTRNGFEGQLDACIRHDAVDRLKKIECPVHITVGLKDIFTPPPFSYLINEMIPHSTLSIYPECGHVHHWEDLDRFNDETLQFLLKN
jgi:pimeloyl-ACP methyl ester carboxylesterase